MKEYSKWIEKLKAKWVGKKINFEGNVYTVMDVDYNGLLLINKPTRYNNTTAIATYMAE